MTNPIRPTDDEARALARGLLAGATYAALGVIDPDTGMPMVSRVALALTPDGVPVSLISSLSGHAKALSKDAACSLLVGEPGDKGDPLTHPRLTVQTWAVTVGRDDPGFAELRAHYLGLRPKSALYIDFGDFYFVRFDPVSAFLNGGFGKAFMLEPDDLTG